MFEKTISRSIRAIFTGSLLVGSGLTTQLVLAQDQKTEAVFITGTRITAPGTTSNSPITSLNAAEIQAAQPIAVEEFFKGIPAAVPAIGPGTNNGSAGAATIDLRGLGPNRTLVLINGRRMVPFDLNGVVDTNAIPVSLINRVDLMTGGASVVYGADAVSGVVNFNLKKNFRGFEVSSSTGVSGNRDAKRNRIDITMGAALDEGKGNVALSIGKTKVDPFTQAQRNWSKQGIASTTGIIQGSNTTVPSQITVAKGNGGTDTLAGAWQVDPTKGVLVQPVGTFNFNPDNYYNTGLDRSQATTLANYKINDQFEPYAEVFYTKSDVDLQLASTGSFATTFDVPIGNPFIPQAMRDQICARRGIATANCVSGNSTIVPMLVDRRFTELGPRFNQNSTTLFQYTVGSRGELIAGWTYDAYFSRGSSDQTSVRKNWGSFAKMRQALNALNTSTCVNNSNGCVPLNVFGAEGSITADMAKFINMDGITLQNVTQDVTSFSASGDLGSSLQSPWSRQAITMSLAAEQRKSSSAIAADEGVQSGDLAGAGGATPNRKGAFTMKEMAMEMNVPLVRDAFMVRNLGLELGYRTTDFSTSAQSRNYNSYKYGGEWEPVKSFRVRGMTQLATRAPNIFELFSPATTGLSNLAKDPCQGNSINAAEANTSGTLSNLCRLTGVPVGSIGTVAQPSAGQINRLTSGNPNLAPEQAKSKTLGFVIEPVAKMAISLDYYQIYITQAITQPSVTDILDGCYDPKFNPTYALNSYCAAVGRNINNGTLNGPASESKGVATPRSNLGLLKTTGYDLNANYQLPLTQIGLSPTSGKLDLNLSYNRVNTNIFQATPTSVYRECLGYYSVACPNLIYKNKFNQRSTWTIGEFTLGYNWRHISGLVIEPLANPTKTNGAPTFLPIYSKVEAYNYLDLNATWNFNKNIRFNFSITNATGKTPPIVGNTVSTTGVNAGNTFPQFYDVVGRYYSVGANLKF